MIFTSKDAKLRARVDQAMMLAQIPELDLAKAKEQYPDIGVMFDEALSKNQFFYEPVPFDAEWPTWGEYRTALVKWAMDH